MTGEAFAEWKRKKSEAREVELASKRAERARTDRMRHVLSSMEHNFLELFPHICEDCHLASLFFVIEERSEGFKSVAL